MESIEKERFKSGGDRSERRLLQVAVAGEGRTAVRLELLEQGRDLLLLITGGEAHVGAVAAASPCRDERDAGGDLQVHVHELPGHREGPLAETAARILARASGRSCAVVAGIHQDRATAPEIQSIVANVARAQRELLAGFDTPTS